MRRITDDDAKAIARAILDELAERAGSRTDYIDVPLPSAAKTGSYVYFFQSFGPGREIKIGYAREVERRLSALRIGSPYEIRALAWFWAADPSEAETSLHHRFAPWSVRGEWFAPTPELLALCDEIRDERMQIWSGS